MRSTRRFKSKQIVNPFLKSQSIFSRRFFTIIFLSIVLILVLIVFYLYNHILYNSTEFNNNQQNNSNSHSANNIYIDHDEGITMKIIDHKPHKHHHNHEELKASAEFEAIYENENQRVSIQTLENLSKNQNTNIQWPKDLSQIQLNDDFYHYK